MLSNSKIKIGSNRSFGLVFFVVFLIISFWSFRGNLNEVSILPFFIAIIFLILGLIKSKLLTPLNKIWFRFGIILGAVIAPIIMAVIFFLVVTPIGLLMKIMGKDLLKKKYNKAAKSYWIKRNQDIGTMKRQF
jgi:large-conductance mechanosensitive channel